MELGIVAILGYVLQHSINILVKFEHELVLLFFNTWSFYTQHVARQSWQSKTPKACNSEGPKPAAYEHLKDSLW